MSEQSPSNAFSGRHTVLACSISTVIIAGVAVLLRLFTRGYLRNVLGKEDCFIMMALVFSVGNTVGMVFQAEVALGQHIWALTEQQIKQFLQEGVYFTIILYNTSLTLTKMSILCLYYRIFTTVYARRACYLLMGLVVLHGLWVTLSYICFCIPVAAFWDLTVQGSCLPRKPMWFASAGLNIAIDMFILLLPMPSLSTLSLPKRQKIGLYLVFGIGFFICIVSILRIPALSLAAESSDPTWDNVGIANWSCVELNTAIVCACLTTLKPLVSKLFPGLLSSSGSGRENAGHWAGDLVTFSSRHSRRSGLNCNPVNPSMDLNGRGTETLRHSKYMPLASLKEQQSGRGGLCSDGEVIRNPV